jgi:hypothetical protein
MGNMSTLLALGVYSGLGEAGAGAGYSTSQTAPQLVGLLISAVLGILGVIFLILVLYAGFQWMTAAGDEKKVASAKSILVRATVGLLICLSAYSISSFVIGALQGAQSNSTSCTDVSCGL